MRDNNRNGKNGGLKYAKCLATAHSLNCDVSIPLNLQLDPHSWNTLLVVFDSLCPDKLFFSRRLPFVSSTAVSVLLLSFILSLLAILTQGSLSLSLSRLLPY